MNKSLLMGVVAGIGVATAGGVLGYQFLGTQGAEVAVEEQAPAASAPAASTPAPVRTAAAPAEECWDEEVQVTADPRISTGSRHRGRRGGWRRSAKRGDRDITTAAGAAAGAFIGQDQEHCKTTARITHTTGRRCARPAPR
jgi:uncharacterized protein YcfJ